MGPNDKTDKVVPLPFPEMPEEDGSLPWLRRYTVPTGFCKWQDRPVLPEAMLNAFAEELEKLAAPIIEDRSEIEKVLKPGDILATRPKDSFLKGKLQHRLLRPLLVAFQGTDYTHVGLYAGNGKVIDSGLWKGKARVTEVPLDTYADRYDFKVLRVKATPSEKRDAVAFAKEQLGKPFSLSKMIRLALPVSKDQGRQREDVSSLFCSELIASAYPNTLFGSGRRSSHVRPVDIQRSPLTKTVAEFR